MHQFQQLKVAHQKHMDRFEIVGGNQLSGEVEISGAKNAVLPMMAASMLSPGKTIFDNTPNLRDTRTFINLLNILGVESIFEDSKLTLNTDNISFFEAPYDLVKTMRASFYVMGPLLARFGEAKVSLPGGCAWGPRPVDYHLRGFEKMGADINLTNGYIYASCKRLKGADIYFEIPSVGATANILMAATLAEGITKITNAAREPHIVQLCEMLNEMGSEINGIGTSDLIIKGVDELKPINISVIPDMIEAGTFLMAGAVLGDIKLNNVNPDHLSIVLESLQKAGCKMKAEDNSIFIEKADEISPVDVATNVHPGFPTDLQAQWIALMSICKGKAKMVENIYHDRFSHIPELNRLGANISIDKNIATINGVTKLIGAEVMSTDIRASASLVLASLFAEGKSTISRVYHIDRGYEKIEEKFQKLGAEIKRISN